MAENASSDGFGSIFCGAAFCLAQPIGGLLVYMIYVDVRTLLHAYISVEVRDLLVRFRTKHSQTPRPRKIGFRRPSTKMQMHAQLPNHYHAHRSNITNLIPF